MTIFIKNMVSTRCILTVKSALDYLGISFTSIEIGEVHTSKQISTVQSINLRENLLYAGLILKNSPKCQLVEKIKSIVVGMVLYSTEIQPEKFSIFISKKLLLNYTYLNNIFSAHEGVSISQFIIQHKIERIKELLQYNELNVREIANLMHYKMWLT